MAVPAPDLATLLGLEEVVQRIPAAVAVVEAPSRRILHVNARARDMAERQLGRPVPPELPDDLKNFHPDGRPYSMNECPIVRSITSGEEVLDEEYFNVLANGSRLIVRCSSAPIHDDEGHIIAGVLVMTDITEQKRIEAQLAYHVRLLENLRDAVIATDERFVVTAWNKGAEEMYGWTADEVIGRNVSEVVPSDLSDEQRDERRRELAETGWQRSVMTTYRKDGAPVYVEGRSITLRGEPNGRITGYLGINRDITDSKRAQREIEQRAHQQAVVAQLGLRAMTMGDVQSLMDRAVALVARTLDVDFVKLDELLPGGEEFLIRADFGMRKRTIRNQIIPAGHGSQSGHTLLSGRSVVAEDLATETRFEIPPIVRGLKAASAASVVVPTRDAPFGALHALSQRRRAFSADDVNFLQAVANVVGTAVERAAGESVLRDAREAERRRIARDLHDEALRGLAYALAETHRAQSTLHGSDAANHLSRLTPALERVGQQVRGAIYDLRLGGEVDRPFSELLGSLVGLHRSMAIDSHIELDARGGVPMGPLGRTGTEVLRIIGEALTNARRHSGARTIRVGVWGSGDTLWAEVSDDGRGFDAAREPAGVNGTGIHGMRERARIVAGDLQIRSGPGVGTKVRLELPLRKHREDPLDEARILLVEDHAAVREAVASAFGQEPGFDVVGQAASLAEARKMLEEVDVAVVDLALPDGYGGALIEDLREASPDAQALVLTASLDRADMARAVESGAAGFLSKTAGLDEVVDAVRRLRAGEALLPLTEVVELLRFAGRQRQQEHQDRQDISRLTPREREVLQALAAGLDSQGIAEQLHITVRTERNHIASILAKLGVHSRLQALVFALRYGIVEIT